jgi:hypothetical protein
MALIMRPGGRAGRQSRQRGATECQSKKSPYSCLPYLRDEILRSGCLGCQQRCALILTPPLCRGATRMPQKTPRGIASAGCFPKINR